MEKKGKRGGARPGAGRPETGRKIRVDIRLSADELKKVRENAKKEGKTVSMLVAVRCAV